MSAIKGIHERDTIENKIFRAVVFPALFDFVKSQLISTWHNGSISDHTSARYASDIMHDLDYEKFPSVWKMIYIIAMTPI